MGFDLSTRVADWVSKFLFANGFDTVFMVTGGGAMHLNDAFGRNPDFHVIHCHHEQACAMAADAYFRISGKPAVVQVTTGPGGVNALNGVFGAFVDSVPMVIVSGQVRSDTISNFVDPRLRQLGDQEVRIIDLAKPVTKTARMIKHIDELQSVFEEAVVECQTGRPGPVWIDVPLDIQAATMPENNLIENLTNYEDRSFDSKNIDADAQLVVDALKMSERPIIIAGNGVRFSGTTEILRQLGKLLQIPITTVWNSHDLIGNDHPSFCGRSGADGDRAGNFSVQNADLILIVGARMAIRQIGFNHVAFGRNAKKIMIDVDRAEMDKQNLAVDIRLQQNLRHFLPAFFQKYQDYVPKQSHKDYLSWCHQKVENFPVFLPHHEQAQPGTINPYKFVQNLFNVLPFDSKIVTGDGTAAVVTFKVANISNDQRLFTNKGCASMGFDLPAVIGAHVASPETPIICIAGDGSLMMNLQELQTIVHHKIPVKLFVLNNDGYHSIRQSQTNYFDGFEVGCGPNSGITFPNFKAISEAFGFEYACINEASDSLRIIKEAVTSESAVFCEVIVDKEQLFEPRVSSRKLPSGEMVSNPLEDMTPLLSREQLKAEMIIDLWQDE